MCGSVNIKINVNLRKSKGSQLAWFDFYLQCFAGGANPHSGNA